VTGHLPLVGVTPTILSYCQGVQYSVDEVPDLNLDCDQRSDISIMASRLLASIGGLPGADNPQPNPSA
jgi:hypothetical protein